MIRSFQALRRVDPGFTEPERVQTFSISIPASVVAEPERVTRMQHELLDERSPPFPASRRRRSRRGCRWAAIAAAPRSLSKDSADDGRTPPNRQVKIVSPGHVSHAGHAARRGTRLHLDRCLRHARRRDRLGEPGARAVGVCRRPRWASAFASTTHRKSPWREIVGVAGDVHDDGADRPAAGDDLLAGAARRATAEHVRIPVAPGQRRRSAPTAPARRVCSTRCATRCGRSTPSLPLAQVRTLDEVYGQSMARTSFTLVMLAIAGAMALLLGVSGIYGVIAYAVSQRRREIGIRLALGAQAADIRRLFLRRGLVLAAIGVAIGLGGAAGVTRLDAIAALRHQPARSDHVHRDARCPRGGGGAGQLSAGAPRSGA